MRSRAERSWMSKGKLQKELRDVEQLSCVSKEVHDNLQQQLQDVEQRRHDLMPEHQKAQKISQKYEASKTKEEICRKIAPQQKKRCGSSKWSSSKKRSVSFSVGQSR